MKSSQTYLVSFWLIFSLLGSTLTSCQSEEPPEAETRNRTKVFASFQRNRNDPQKEPDSIVWTSNTQFGSATVFTIDSSAETKIGYTVSLALHRPLGSDTLRLALYSMGLHILDIDYAAGTESTDELSMVDGSVAYQDRQLEYVSGLYATLGKYPRSVEGMQAYLAHRALSDTSFFMPPEVDASEIRRLALVEAATVGKPLADQARTWGLDLSYDSARSITLKLIAERRILSADSAILFPPPPIRIKSPFSVRSNLRAGGDPVGMLGAFEWNDKLGLIGIRYAVVRNLDTIRTITLVGLQSPNIGDRQASFDEVKLQASAETPPGEYSLILVAVDGAGDSAVASSEFTVETFALVDTIGPKVEWVSPSSKDTILENRDSLLPVRLHVSDPTGVANVLIDGRSAIPEGDDWSLEIVVPIREQGFSILVKATDSNGFSTEDRGKAFRKQSTVSGAPNARLLSPLDNTFLPFDSSEVIMNWIVTSPQGRIDSVTIDGGAAVNSDDSVWSARVHLAPTGKPQSIILRARNTAKLWTTEVASITRGVDKSGPDITWINPTADQEMEYGVTSIFVRIKATDPSGIESVTIDGLPPDSSNAAGLYVKKIPLTTVGSPISVVVRAVDSVRNPSSSSLSITRLNKPTDVPPKVVLETPSTKSLIVPFETKTILVRWIVTDSIGVDSETVAINGAKATSEPGNKWSAMIDLAPGIATSINLSAKNKNGIAGGDVVSVTRRGDTVEPTLTEVAGSRNLGFDSTDALVSWMVHDNDSISSVIIGGVEIASSTGTYSRRIPLVVGDNHVEIVATDKSGNDIGRTALIHRYQEMSIRRSSPVSDTSVPASTTSFPIAWIVSNARSVKIGGSAATSTTNRFETTLPLATGSNRLTLIAFDSTGASDSSTITITRREQVSLILSYGLDTSRTLPDSIVVAASSESGATLSWSMDGSSWTPFVGSFTQKLSGTALVRSQLAGKDAKIASLKAFVLHSYPKTSLSRLLPIADTIVPNTSTSFSVSWLVRNAKSVRINGNLVTSTTDTFRINLPLAVGTNSALITTTDSAGRIDSNRVVITRRRQVALTVSFGKDTSLTLPDSVVIAATSDSGASLAWSMDGNAWTTFKGTFTQKQSGTAIVRAQLAGTDEKTASLKAFFLHSYPKTTLSRLFPISDTIVPNASTSFPVSWRVRNAKSVRINGNLTTSTTDTFRIDLPLAVGTNPALITTTDSAGRIDSNRVSITRRQLVSLTLSYGIDTLVSLPDSVVIAVTGESGSTLTWSTDSITWTPFTGAYTQKQSGRVLIRAQLAGKDDKIASLKAFTLFKRTPVYTHGMLKASGNRILDAHGNPVQLAGMSLSWPLWGGELFFNATAVKSAIDLFGVNLIRAPMAVASGSQIYYSRDLTPIKTVIEAAIANGIYVIVDWHSVSTNPLQVQADSFFREIASAYGRSPNVIFEIWSAPAGPTWNAVKQYAEVVIDTIRNYSENLVIVGTPNWSQSVDLAAASPLAKRNIAYALQFFACTHGSALRTRAQAAADSLPLFFSEWTPTATTGIGNICLSEADAWLALAKANHISWTNWSLSSKADSWDALMTNTPVTGPWTDADLTPSGQYVKAKIREVTSP